MLDVAITGRLGTVPELKTSAKTGKQYCRVSVAISVGAETERATVIAFDEHATALAQAEKGSAIYCEGRGSLDRWTDREGKARTSLSVVAHYVRSPQIGQRRPKRSNGKRQAPSQQSTPSADGNDFHDDPIGF